VELTPQPWGVQEHPEDNYVDTRQLMVYSGRCPECNKVYIAYQQDMERETHEVLRSEPLYEIQFDDFWVPSDIPEDPHHEVDSPLSPESIAEYLQWELENGPTS
jgi:hypothetical protein